MTEHPNTEREIKQNLKLLSRGLMQPDYTAAYKAYRNLYRLGRPAIEPLKSKILEVDWSKSWYKELSRYISGIFALIHDLDEKESNALLLDIVSMGCPKHIRVLHKPICYFSQEHYRKYRIYGIDIFEHKEIIKKGITIGGACRMA